MRVVFLLPSLLLACGGSVVAEPGQGAGGASAAATSSETVGASSASASSTAAGSGGGPCTSQADCPNGVCIFSTGQCAPACQDEFCADCGPGLVCDTCATSSCPKCNDCKAACVPPKPGRCDDTDPCPAGEACQFTSGDCFPLCTANGTCDNAALFCSMCATGSCCGCENCVSLCLPPKD